MNNPKIMLETWSIFSRLFLLGFVIWESYFLRKPGSGWSIFVYLIVICFLFAGQVLRKPKPRQAAALLSAGFLAYCAGHFELPLLYLLLPASLTEFAAGMKPKVLGPVLIFVSAWLIPQQVLALYIAAAGISWLGHTLIRVSVEKLGVQNERNETMNADLQRLTKALIENRELARQSEYTIKLEERNRLSQQIHDEIGHSMAGALIQMEASKRLLASNPDKAAELLGNAIAISKEGLEQIRLTLKDMKPKSEEIGINRLRLFVDELSAKQGLAASLTHEGNLDAVTPIQWKVILENATEAVTNTIKYGEADHVHVHVQVLNRLVKAVVADNGKGSDKVVKGLGILGMEERAASLGGTVITDGSNGFSVITLLPTGGQEVPHGAGS
ncbi:sensor histidine kinase [Paenibacillus pinistramenti]|uniref:sensor histidine kinase n=1 Tax=Paenibacillus pinistramenti TaxID=1768003 RepID=UPI001EF1267D|nr:sensor histidine kinase [Paenibacillus pinistramenti]